MNLFLVSVIGIRKEYNDNQISVIAKYIKTFGVEKDLVVEDSSAQTVSKPVFSNDTKESAADTGADVPVIKITNKNRKYRPLTGKFG